MVVTPLNALFVSHGSGLGGAERVLLELLEGLDRGVVDPTVVVPEDDALAHAARQLGVPVIVCAAPWWLPFDTEDVPGYLFRRYWEDAPRFVQPLADHIASRHIDVVYSSSSPILHAALAAHVTRRPHLQHMQDLLGWPHLGFHMPFDSAGAAYWLLGRLSSLVVCVGRTIREDIGGAIPADKCRIVPLGWRPPASLPAAMPLPETAPDVIRVGIVGVVDRRKGADVIADIAQRVCIDVPNVHFYWAGAGDEALRARLSAEAVIVGEPHLHFLGYTARVADFMHSMDFLLHPARNETFPRALLEGAAAARAIVATRCGGGQEIIQDGVTGLLAPVDDVEAIASAVVQLARDPDRCRRMGAMAQAWASRFDMASYQAGMQQALVEAHRKGPAIPGAVASRVVSGLISLPGWITPPLRRWSTGSSRQDARP